MLLSFTSLVKSNCEADVELEDQLQKHCLEKAFKIFYVQPLTHLSKWHNKDVVVVFTMTCSILVQQL